MNRTTKATYKAVMMSAPTTIQIDRHVDVTITDRGGRRRWSASLDASTRATLLVLSVPQAAGLLRSLADAIAFLAEEPEPINNELLECGCPLVIVDDEGDHQLGCEKRGT